MITIKENQRIRPVSHLVIVLVDRQEEKIGNIIIPETTKENMQNAGVSGVLLAKGPTAYKDSKGEDISDVNIGDTVVFRSHAGIEAQRLLEEETPEPQRILNDTDICGVIEDVFPEKQVI